MSFMISCCSVISYLTPKEQIYRRPWYFQLSTKLQSTALLRSQGALQPHRVPLYYGLRQDSGPTTRVTCEKVIVCTRVANAIQALAVSTQRLNNWDPEVMLWINNWDPVVMLWINNWDPVVMLWINNWGPVVMLWINNWGPVVMLWINNWGTL